MIAFWLLLPVICYALTEAYWLNKRNQELNPKRPGDDMGAGILATILNTVIVVLSITLVVALAIALYIQL
jgi:hypothetical protein